MISCYQHQADEFILFLTLCCSCLFLSAAVKLVKDALSSGPNYRSFLESGDPAGAKPLRDYFHICVRVSVFVG